MNTDTENPHFADTSGQAVRGETGRVKERPILFSAPMVQALLAGTKTQTRRALKPQPPAKFLTGDVAAITNGKRWSLSKMPGRIAWHPDPVPGILCPYGLPGDRLWVREAWRTFKSYDALPPRELLQTCAIWREADASPKVDRGPLCGKLRASMFMPRWASRILLEVTDVRVQLLQDISEEDAKAEGAKPIGLQLRDGRRSSQGVSHWNGYVALWESIHGPGTWDVDTWVWCVSFRPLTA